MPNNFIGMKPCVVWINHKHRNALVKKIRQDKSFVFKAMENVPTVPSQLHKSENIIKSATASKTAYLLCG